MTAVIQAGGHGMRLRELTHDKIPKPLFPIDGIPIIKRQIDTLAREGISEFIIITGHLGDMIERFVGDGKSFGAKLRFFRESIPLGSGGALPAVADMIGHDDCLLINGDLVFDFYLERMIRFHNEKKAEITLFAHPNTHPHDSDLLKTDKSGRVMSIDFKNNIREYWYENLINAGTAIINPRVLRGFPRNAELNFEHDIVRELTASGSAIYAYRSPEYVRDAGTPDRLREAERDIISGLTAARNLRNKQKAIFSDRDGTINKDAGLLYKEDQFELSDGASEAIRIINNSGYLALCVTNQSVVARGLCTEDDVRCIHNKMETLLGERGAYLDGVAFCPHHPDKGYPEERPEYKIRCDCRKPGVGMITDFARRFNIDLSESWMVGDTETDMQCGVNAGLHTCLIGNAPCRIKADIKCVDLLDAVQKIIDQSRSK